MRTQVSNIKSYITKAKNQSASHLWFSCETMTDEEVILLSNYFEKNKHPIALFVRDIPSSRPGRTWGSMPEWFRPASAWSDYDACPDPKGDFIFVWLRPDDPDGVFEDELSSHIFKNKTYKSLNLFKDKTVWVNGIKTEMEETK